MRRGWGMEHGTLLLLEEEEEETSDDDVGQSGAAKSELKEGQMVAPTICGRSCRHWRSAFRGWRCFVGIFGGLSATDNAPEL